MEKTGSSVALAFRVDDDEVGGGKGTVSQSDVSRKLAESKSWTNSGNNLEEPKFFNFEAKEAFNRLRQAFTKGPIFRHFDLESHIRIEIDASGYAIGEVLSQLTPNQETLDKAIGSNVD